MDSESQKMETQCLHEGYRPENGGPGVPPIVQSTTYRFDSTEHIAKLFDMPTECIYSRFANPTCDAVEKKLAALEGGVGAMLTSSGQAASLIALLNVCSAGDSFIAMDSLYGGTVNLFAVTLKRLGIECIWVDGDASEEEMNAAFKENTRAVFGETLTNPSLNVCDIEKLARVAHGRNVPLIIDNTFATPVLCKPFAWGADVVIHSTSKYLDGHALQVGGAIVDSGNFDWAAAYKKTGTFADFVEPDDSYHGIKYTEAFGKAAFIIKARMQLMRDFGCYPSAHSAFLLNVGLETLPLRMRQYCENGLKVAEYFSKSEKIASVNYPALPGDVYKSLGDKYLPDGASGVVSVSVKGGREKAMKFTDALKLASKEVHVADIRTCVLHPASSTHRQLTDAQLDAAGIDGGMIRFSCGLEHIDDIIADIEQALAAI